MLTKIKNHQAMFNKSNQDSDKNTSSQMEDFMNSNNNMKVENTPAEQTKFLIIKIHFIHL